MAVPGLVMLVRKLVHDQPGSPDDFEGVFRLPMNELGAELDRHRCIAIMDGINPPADAVASLDQDDAEPGVRQIPRSRETRRTGSDHQRVDGSFPVSGHCGVVPRSRMIGSIPWRIPGYG